MTQAEATARRAVEERRARLARLGSERFDVLVVGGGATGAGAALDAATRGLKVALVERADFAQGTSSRSTKLVHGGVRYLEQAVKHADRSQFRLVREALHERARLLRNAPHLARPLPLLTPVYGALELPYYFTGLKLYDMLAGRANLRPSHLVGRAEALARFPMLKHEGLKGAVEYYDGQFDDARMNVTLVRTAEAHGAAVTNHAEVVQLVKRDGRVTGAVLLDRVAPGAQPFEVSARVVVNATGPFADALRTMDDAGAEPMLKASSGVHIVLPARFSPVDTGLLIPHTEDGRVLFLLPWQGRTLVGTTDSPAAVEPEPLPEPEAIEYILRHVRRYFDLPVERTDVLAAWSGLRPLVELGHEGASTARLSRDHAIVTSASGLVTIAGGKWTTYRRMAEDVVDVAIETGRLEPRSATLTRDLLLLGAEGFDQGGYAELMREYALPEDVARHLNSAYGSLAPAVVGRGSSRERLAAGYPYVEAEVEYACEHEYACYPDDVLARRMRLAFLDEGAAAAVRARVAELMD